MWRNEGRRRTSLAHSSILPYVPSTCYISVVVVHFSRSFCILTTGSQFGPATANATHLFKLEHVHRIGAHCMLSAHSLKCVSVGIIISFSRNGHRHAYCIPHEKSNAHHDSTDTQRTHTSFAWIETYKKCIDVQGHYETGHKKWFWHETDYFHSRLHKLLLLLLWNLLANKWRKKCECVLCVLWTVGCALCGSMLQTFYY